MSGVNPVLFEGPDTVSVNVAVTGGQLVMPDSTTGKVKPATASAATCIGVALADGQPLSARTNLNFSTARNVVAIAYGGMDVPGVTYAANANWGAKLKAAATGQVTPWISGTDAADLIIGICAEPAGVTSGNTGRVRLSV
jgi:hypothetical protein